MGWIWRRTLDRYRGRRAYLQGDGGVDDSIPIQGLDVLHDLVEEEAQVQGGTCMMTLIHSNQTHCNHGDDGQSALSITSECACRQQSPRATFLPVEKAPHVAEGLVAYVLVVDGGTLTLLRKVVGEVHGARTAAVHSIKDVPAHTATDMRC